MRDFFSPRAGKELKVHGLLVDGAVPRLTKEHSDRIQAISCRLKNNEVKDEDLAKVNRQLAYVKSVEKLSQQ